MATPPLRDALVALVATLAHEDWRNQWKAQNGDKPRIKPTKDTAWIEANTGKTELNIAEAAYADLPSDWQKENRLGAEVVVGKVLEAVAQGTELDDSFVEQAADAAHVSWLDRNGSWAPAHQKLPYAELAEDEKEKDRVFVRRAIEAYRQHA